MLRLDHNRVDSTCSKAGVAVSDIENMTVWVTTQRCMLTTVLQSKRRKQKTKSTMLLGTKMYSFLQLVNVVLRLSKRVVLSSAASAANAAIDHMRDWALAQMVEWVTMGIPSDGSYGIPEGVNVWFPVTTENGEYKIVQGLRTDEFSRERINFTLNELEEERAAIADMLE